MRTKPDAGVTLITGIDFYTHATEEVALSLYSRLGSFQDFKDSTDGWDLIAEGTVKGRGVGRYTNIPEEMFTPVDIPGGGGEGGTRAFYLSMSSINLVYKTALGDASDSEIVAETPDIEIWDGEVRDSRIVFDSEIIQSTTNSDLVLCFAFLKRGSFLEIFQIHRIQWPPCSSDTHVNSWAQSTTIDSHANHFLLMVESTSYHVRLFLPKLPPCLNRVCLQSPVPQRGDLYHPHR